MLKVFGANAGRYETAYWESELERSQDCQAPKFTVTVIIQDKCGYSYVRDQSNAKNNVIGKLYDNEQFYTSERKGNYRVFSVGVVAYESDAYIVKFKETLGYSLKEEKGESVRRDAAGKAC